MSKRFIERNPAPLFHPPVGDDQIGFVFGNEVRITEGSTFSRSEISQHFQHVGVLVVSQPAFVFFDWHVFKIPR